MDGNKTTALQEELRLILPQAAAAEEKPHQFRTLLKEEIIRAIFREVIGVPLFRERECPIISVYGKFRARFSTYLTDETAFRTFLADKKETDLFQDYYIAEGE